MLPRPSLAHLVRLTDDTGIFEHALGSVPRRTHGWCTDDQGRALAIVARASEEPGAARLADTYLAFLVHAHRGDGRFRLRMGYDRTWTYDPPSDDANARALYGLAVAAARGPEHLRWTAAKAAAEACGFRSHHPRAVAHAAVGAAELVGVDPGCSQAWSLLGYAAQLLPRPAGDLGWPWPAPRLTYANALIPEGLIATGVALGDDALVLDGLALLRWLVGAETLDDRFSFTPTGGRGRADPRPAFDQQPIEASSMADACARAFDVTGDPEWLLPLARAADWCIGDNDAGVPLYDPATHGGFDGLIPGDVNRNEGAESTLAVVSVLQQAHRLLPLRVLDLLTPAVPGQRMDESFASR
jgi:hypothetical protein